MSRTRSGRGPAAPAYRPVRRGVLAGLALVLASAGPAFAHALDGASPTNYRTRITEITPRVPGIDVRVVEAGNRLELSNETDREAVVLGYREEPYLRVGPDGVFENRRSPATYLNRSRFPTDQLPEAADADAPPEWERVSSASSVRWHDHRTHWMGEQPPGPVRRAPGEEHVIFPAWEVPIVVDGGEERIAVRGDLMWVPGPSRWPWLALAAAVGAAVALLGRGRAARVVIVAALGGLVAFDVLRLAGMAGDSSASFADAALSNPQAIAAWLLAVLAAGRLAVRDTRMGLPLAAAAGVIFALNSFTDLNDLARSQLPTTSPYWLARLAVAVGLGAGLGVVVAAATTLGAPAPRRATTERAAEADAARASSGQPG